MTDPIPRTLCTYRTLLMPWDCDQIGHANTRVHMAAFDAATGVLMTLVGAPLPAAGDHDGPGWADVRQEITYHQEILSGQVLSVFSRIDRIGRSSVTYIHDLVVHGRPEPAARMTGTCVRFNRAARRSCPLEPALRARIQQEFAPAEEVPRPTS